MDFLKLNEELLDLYENFQLNEMAIYYGTDHGTVDNVIEGFKRLNSFKEGMVHVNQMLKVSKLVTQEEIDKGLFDPIQKDVFVTRDYPIILVWGEKDKTKNNKSLEGHGLTHIIQGHKQDFNKVIPKLQQIINKKVEAKPDKFGNYGVRLSNYRFIFTLVEKKMEHQIMLS